MAVDSTKKGKIGQFQISRWNDDVTENKNGGGDRYTGRDEERGK